ncbi:MAG: HAMP domain-containing protein, partial [Deltaproteobacteria bacterium]
YISRGSQSVTGEGVERAQHAGQLEADLAAVRRGESAWHATSDAGQRRAQGSRWATSLTVIGASIEHMTASSAASGAQLRDLRDAYTRAVAAQRTTVERVDAGDAIVDVQPASFAAYDRALTTLESGAHAMTGRAFAAVSAQSNLLYGWIFRLQSGLFVVVLICQVFSAWAGWTLSKSLSGELNGLKESAERISMGDLTSEVKVATGDTEIVALGEALDRLRVSLAKAMERLTRRGAAAAPRHASNPPPAHTAG